MVKNTTKVWLSLGIFRLVESPKPKLLDLVRQEIRFRHFSYRTEQAYVLWTRRFVLFHGKRHPAAMGAPQVREFLSWLANERNVAGSTQDQALSALLFLYASVLRRPIKSLEGIARAKKPKRLPVVLDEAEILAILDELQGEYWLLVGLLYGSGLRLMESLRLRIKDLDFSHRCVVVRSGKGGKDRVVTLADNLVPGLRVHLKKVRLTYEQDCATGKANVWLPHAFARKYPGAPSQWAWQFVFPARKLSRDPQANVYRRHHVGERSLQRAVRAAVVRAGIGKPGCHATRSDTASRRIC